MQIDEHYKKDELIVSDFPFTSKTNVYSAGPRLEPLSAVQPTFKQGYDAGTIYTFYNCSLLHKLLITGQEEQVVSRRGELNGDLLSGTCKMGGFSKVKSKIGLIKFWNKTT